MKVQKKNKKVQKNVNGAKKIQKSTNPIGIPWEILKILGI